MRSALFLAVFAVVAGRGGCGPVTPHDPYDPCEGKVCGESCGICPPESPCPTFAATACDPLGECATVGTFKCEEPPPIDPCAGKVCGDACTTCDPALGMACPAVMMYCDAAGACGFAFPVCTTTTR